MRIREENVRFDALRQVTRKMSEETSETFGKLYDALLIRISETAHGFDEELFDEQCAGQMRGNVRYTLGQILAAQNGNGVSQKCR